MKPEEGDRFRCLTPIFFSKQIQVIIAAGEEVDVSFLPRGIKKKEGIVLTHTGGRTSVDGIFAGGDFASRERTVAHAIGSGKKVGHCNGLLSEKGGP